MPRPDPQDKPAGVVFVVIFVVLVWGAVRILLATAAA